MLEAEFKKEQIAEINDLIKQSLNSEFEAQGHKLTGKTMRSISAKVIQGKLDLTIEFYGSSVIPILNKGVSAARIPFSKGSGANSSLYIQALTEYAKKRMGANDKDAKGIAFAIAQTHKKEGMPSKGSYQYSNSGERLMFVDIALDKISSKIAVLTQNLFSTYVETTLDNFIKAHQ